MAKTFAVVLLLLSALGPVTGISLDGNGYIDILIAINPAVLENEELINQTKRMIITGSEYLHQALDNKVFIKEVKILVPPNWHGTYERARREIYDRANIIIDNPHPAFGDEPYTKQLQGCGEEGKHIHFTPNFLLDDNNVNVFGPRGRVFVHEWAHLRWGVFDEYNEKKPFYLLNNQIEPTRCSREISGQWYEVINGNILACRTGQDGLPTQGCQFFPDRVQRTNASIMYMQSLDSVRAFCREEDHNTDAENMQNEKCASKATRTVIFEDSVDKDALRSLTPLQSPPPSPTFRVIQRRHRTICLILDVSGSMRILKPKILKHKCGESELLEGKIHPSYIEGDTSPLFPQIFSYGERILRQQQAATIFLSEIVEEGAYVGIVQFSTNADLLSSLIKIEGKASRDSLIKKLPTVASGSTNMCTGLNRGFKVLEEDDQSAVGDDVIFLTDGEATDNVESCLQSAVDSGATISTFALGPDASNVLITMADRTDGKFVVANETLLSNQLVDAFSSLTLSDGDPIKQAIQLVSLGRRITDWFNGTVPIDHTIGNGTTFTIIYEKRTPTVYIQAPSGSVYNQTHVSDTAATKTVTLNIPGTAEPGDWIYSFLNTEPTEQTMSLTVTTRAARNDILPVMVKTEMNQLSTDGSKPLVVFAEVSSGYSPVIGANVTATLQSDTGHSETLYLLDNGAAADVLKDDGIYSRYFTKFRIGRYSLKVEVRGGIEKISASISRYSGAVYIPGYIVDGKVELNPPKPPVNVQPADVGSFTRTTTGESFVVSLPPGVTPPNFPPSKITDLSAEIQEDTVLLNWTAPGEDFDQGTAESYDIRWSENLTMLLNNFSDANPVNTSTLQPQEAGSAEHHSFLPDFTIQNGTTLFFAVLSEDKEAMKSEVSNIARVTKFVPSPKPPAISNPGLNLTAIVVSVCVVTMVACLIAAVTTWAMKRKNIIKV